MTQELKLYDYYFVMYKKASSKKGSFTIRVPTKTTVDQVRDMATEKATRYVKGRIVTDCNFIKTGP